MLTGLLTGVWWSFVTSGQEQSIHMHIHVHIHIHMHIHITRPRKGKLLSRDHLVTTWCIMTLMYWLVIELHHDKEPTTEQKQNITALVKEKKITKWKKKTKEWKCLHIYTFDPGSAAHYPLNMRTAPPEWETETQTHPHSLSTGEKKTAENVTRTRGVIY